MRKDYVLGFAFNSDRTRVVLIHKNRPAWQAGKLNGVGGKIENNETAVTAMTREFAEECGVATDAGDWHYFAKIAGRDGDVFCYRLFDNQALAATTSSDEDVILSDVDLNALRSKGMNNLAWLIAIALDDSQPHFFVEAQYDQGIYYG